MRILIGLQLAAAALQPSSPIPPSANQSVVPEERIEQVAPLTLDGAIRIARSRSPLLQAAEARRMTTEGRALAEGAFPNPLFEWRRENLGSSLQPDIFATVQLPLDITGRRLKLRSAVRDGVQRAQADSAQTVRAFEYNVVHAFWNAALADALLQVARDDLDARRRLATFDSLRFAEGAVSEVTAIRTRLEASRARAAELSAFRDVERARAALARMIGVAVESLPPVAALPTLKSLNLGGAPTEAQAVATALEQRPDVLTARFAESEASRRASAERRGVISDLQLVSGYKQTSGVNSGVLGVALPLPLFSRNEGVAMRARGEHLMMVSELRDLELKVRGEVHAAIETFRATQSALAAGVQGMEADADEIAQVAEGAYREGAVSLIDVVEAQRTRAESRANAWRWVVSALIATLDLRMATGESLTGNMQ